MKTEPDFKTVKFNQIDKNDELENSSDVFKLDFSLKGWIRKSDQIKGTVFGERHEISYNTQLFLISY